MSNSFDLLKPAVNPYLAATLQPYSAASDASGLMSPVANANPAPAMSPVNIDSNVIEQINGWGQPNDVNVNLNTSSDGDWFWGGKNRVGAFQQGTQAVGALAQSWLGLQQLNLMKDQFAFQKEAYNTNLANQTKTVNTQLEDRQNARVAQTNGQMMSTEEYMAKHGL